MRQLRNMIIAAALTTGMAYSGWVGYRAGSGVALREYVDANIDRIMQEQEKHHGIKFTGKPKISYMIGVPIPGTYYGGDTIWIDMDDTIPPGYLPEHILLRLMKRDANRADETLHHELGHVYLKQLRSRNLIAQPQGPEQFRAQRVEEGIAEYFERSFTNDGSFEPFRSGPWKMVKPIIDAYGERGVLYMAGNLPDMGESAEDYQKRVLEALKR